MPTLREKKSAGIEAQDLMRRLAPYIATLRGRYIEGWVTGENTAEEREQLHTRVSILSDLEREIRRVIQDGVIADEIIRLEKGKQDG